MSEQPLTASAFINAMADIFQARHHGSLSRERAVQKAVCALEMIETPEHPFGHPDFGWAMDDAWNLAAEAMEYWESAP